VVVPASYFFSETKGVVTHTAGVREEEESERNGGFFRFFIRHLIPMQFGATIRPFLSLQTAINGCRPHEGSTRRLMVGLLIKPIIAGIDPSELRR